MEGMLGIGLAVGLAALGVGLGQGIGSNGALSGMARQPEASGKIQTGMLIALAFMELVFLLTFVTAIMMQGKLGPGS
jgi:F-type H+-transporting ATPase subunit c